MVCCGPAKPAAVTTPAADKAAAHKNEGMLADANRKCTDVFCCLIFILFWIGMIVIGAIGLRYGQPMRLVYGTDYQGQVCGIDGAVSGRKYTSYPRTNEDFLVNLGKTNPLDFKFYGVCVSSCPALYDVVCNYQIATTVPQNVRLQCMINSTSYTPPSDMPSCAQIQRSCWVTPQPTSSILFRCIPVYNVSNTAGVTCIFPPGITSPLDPACITVRDSRSGTTERPAKPNILFDQLNAARQVWGRWLGDLARAWWVILVCSVLLAMVFGFAWLILAKWCTGIIVWTTIVLLIVGVGALDAYFYFKAGLLRIEVPESLQAQLNQYTSSASGAASSVSYMVPQTFSENSNNYTTAYKVLAFLFTFICIVLIAMVVVLRVSIRIAIAVVKLGAEAMQAIPSMVIFPLSTVAALALFVAWWIFVAASLATAGQAGEAALGKDVLSGLNYVRAQYGNTSITSMNTLLNSPTLNDTIKTIDDMPVMNYLLIYHFFGLLWTTQFIMGIAIMTLAGAVCGWYFSLNDGKNVLLEGDDNPLRYKQPRIPVLSSLCRVLRFHMGSVAFGSFLIALIQFIRAIMAYVQRQLERYNKNSSTIRFIMCCIQSCLWCLQKCVEFITRNAFIYTALKGYSFWGAGASVFKLIVSYAWTLAIVNVLGEVIMFLGKIMIAIACAWIGYAILDSYPAFQTGGAQEISSTWLVILVILFFSYAIATSFMMVFDISVDAVLVCYVTDIDENNARESAAGRKVTNTPLHVKKDKFDARARAAAAEAAEEAAAAQTANPTNAASPAGGVSYVSPVGVGVGMQMVPQSVGAPPKVV